MSKNRKSRKNRNQFKKSPTESKQRYQTEQRLPSVGSTNDATGKDGNNGNLSKQDRHHLFRLPQINGVAIFTGLLVIATAFSAWAVMVSQRANLAAVSIDAAFPPAVDAPLSFKLAAINTGPTTASVIRECALFNDGGVQPPASPDYSGCTPKVQAGLIPNGQKYYGAGSIYKNGTPVVLGRDEMAAIRQGTLKAYFYGFIDYNDVYSFILGARNNGFCFMYIAGAEARWGNCNLPQYEYSH